MPNAASVNPGLSQVVGYDPQQPGVSTFGLSAAANWLAFAFLAPPAAPNLTEVSVYFSVVTGSLGATDITATLYSDAGGKPGSTLSVSSTTTSPSPPVAGWVRFTFNTALTAGTFYWVVLTNGNGTPGSNFPSIGIASQSGDNITSGGGAAQASAGFAISFSTNSGTSWIAKTSAAGYRIGFSDSTYMGIPIQNITQPGTNQKVFGSNECGIKFTVPSNVTWNVIGAAFYPIKGGSPTGNLTYKLYDGTHTLLATSNAVSNTLIGSGKGWFPAYFSAVQTLAGGSTFSLTMKNSAADSSSNYWGQSDVLIDSDANSALLIPWSMIEDTYNGTTWSTQANTIVPWALILQQGSEYASSGSGSGGGKIIGA